MNYDESVGRCPILLLADFEQSTGNEKILQKLSRTFKQMMIRSRKKRVN